MERPLDLDKIMASSAKYYSEHKGTWEFSQMFGEEDDPANGSGSESGGEGTIYTAQGGEFAWKALLLSRTRDLICLFLP